MTENQILLKTLQNQYEVQRLSLARLIAKDAPTEDEQIEMRSSEKELAAILERKSIAGKLVESETRNSIIKTGFNTTEGQDFADLELRASLQKYMVARLDESSLDGAEKELSTELGIEDGHVPTRMLVPAETRTTTNVNSKVQPRPWLDRLLDATGVAHLGIATQSVQAGQSSFPTLATGATGAQRGREESASAGAWTVAVNTLSPTRNSLRYEFATEDDLRNPGLQNQLKVDGTAAMAERIDYTVLKGDSGANENTADVAGILGLSGVGETTLTQTNKVKGVKTVEVFTNLIDGAHAVDVADVRILSFEGATQLWHKTDVESSNTGAQIMTLARFMNEQGLSFKTRGGIETTTTNGKYAAIAALQKGLGGAGIIAVWDSVKMIVDPYSAADKSQVRLIFHYFWNYILVRKSNFHVIKFVT